MLLSDITPTWLKNTFLFGIDITDQNGNEISDSALQFYIDSAIDMAEKLLDISIKFIENVEEKHDTRYNERLQGWTFIQLYKKPVSEIKELSLVYGTNQMINFPLEWVQVEKLRGQLQVVPAYGTTHIPFITYSGAMLMPTFGFHAYIPQVMYVKYDAGYKSDEEIPDLLARLIGMLSAIGMLDVGGDIVLGMPALSGYSLGIDGLSQTIQTTNSATSAAYRGRIESYNRQIKDQILPALRTYYHGIKVVGA